MKFRRRDQDSWEASFDLDEDVVFEILDPEESEDTLFPEDAHDALKRLTQKTNKRGAQMKPPRRSESWR